MRLPTMLPLIGCAFWLAACATDGSAPPAVAPVKLEAYLAQADTALKAGQNDKALGYLKGAAGAYPTAKTPWLQMAKVNFDRASYGEAILNAQEALQRDPADKNAHSIIAVSGMRLSTKAITDLTRQNNFSGSVRSEVRDLAKLLRASVDDEQLVPPAAPAAAKRAPARRGATTVPATAPAGAPKAKGAGDADPFGALK